MFRGPILHLTSQAQHFRMQKLLASLAAATFLYPAAQAGCPNYSDYSQQYHAPFSSGRYNLSYMRPEPACRTFNSSIVEDTITSMQSVIKDPDLYRIFQNSFPNSLDTAVKWKGSAANNSEEELTFLITGDINAMWLRDSANQVSTDEQSNSCLDCLGRSSYRKMPRRQSRRKISNKAAANSLLAIDAVIPYIANPEFEHRLNCQSLPWRHQSSISLCS